MPRKKPIDSKKTLRDIALLYADYEAELRMSSRDNEAVEDCKKKFIEAHADMIRTKWEEKDTEYRKSTTVKHLINDILKYADPDKRDDLWSITDVKEKKEIEKNAKRYLNTIRPENGKKAIGVYEFQRWVYRNAKAHGTEYLGGKGSPLEYLEKNFFNQSMEVQRRALFYLEKNYRKEAQSRRIDRENEFEGYVPDAKKLRDKMVGTNAKVWKLFDGSRYYWDKLKGCIEKAVADDKELHLDNYLDKKDVDKKSEKSALKDEPIFNEIKVNVYQPENNEKPENKEEQKGIDVDQPEKSKGISPLIGGNNDDELIKHEAPLPGLVIPEKKPGKHGDWKNANHGFKSVESYIYNTEKKLTDWNYTYGQVEKLPDNFAKFDPTIPKAEDREKASYKFSKRAAEKFFGSEFVKQKDDTLKSVPTSYDTYDGITDVAFNTLGVVNNVINVWDNISDASKNRQKIEKREKRANAVEAGFRVANAGLSVASGVAEKIISKEPVNILAEPCSGVLKDCTTYIKDKGLAALGKPLGIFADVCKFASGLISHWKTWNRRSKLEDVEKTTPNLAAKTKRRIGLLKYLNKLNYINSVPKMLTALCGIVAGVTTMFIAAPFVAAGATIIGAAIGLVSSKVWAELPNRRKKREAIDSELLVDDKEMVNVEQRKKTLKNGIKMNYDSADPCVKKRMRNKLSIKIENDKTAKEVKSSWFQHHLGNILRREAIAEKGYLNMNAAYTGLLGNIAEDSVKELSKDKNNEVHRAILNAGGVSTKKIRKPEAPKKGALNEQAIEPLNEQADEALKKREEEKLNKHIAEAKEIMAKL